VIFASERVRVGGAFPFTNVRDALIHGWTLTPFVTLLSLLTLLVYIRGWYRGHILRPGELPAWRAICFCCGVLAFKLAVASPIIYFDDVLLTTHMVQHLILMSVAPLLLLLGAPAVPLLRGLPHALLQNVFAPLLRSRSIRAIAHALLHPITGWLALNLAFLGWHVPAAYEFALHSELWHEVEHACFFFTAILFWWTVVQPWPSRPVWPRWKTIPYLLTADFVNTGLSAFLAFNGRVLYPSYAAAPRVFDISPINDQIAAGAFMWVFGSLFYLIPVVIIVFRLMEKGVPLRPYGKPIDRAA
jgi:putative membrane protein